MDMSKKNSPAKNKASKLTLLQPMELARLAAILRPESRPKAALETAMQFYVEAVLFCREHSAKTFQDLFDAFASDETQRAQRVRKLEQELKTIREDTLELDPQKRGADVDAVRKFLAEHGLPLKTARAVFDNFRRYWDQPLPKDAFRLHERRSAESVIAECEHMSDGKKTYHLSKSLLESVANYAKWRGKERKRKSWHTRKSRDKPAQKTVKEKIQKSSV